MPFNMKRRSKLQPTDHADKLDKPKPAAYSFRRLFKISKWKRKPKKSKEIDHAAPTDPPPKSPIPKAESVAASNRTAGHSVLQQESNEGDSNAKTLSVAKQPDVIQNLSEEDIRSLFSGAPQFSISIANGQLQPSASFPWDFSLRVRDVSDCPPLDHLAYSAATLRRHLPSPGKHSDRDASLVEYDIGVVEVPSMLSARGTELGTVGFEYFLQEPVADALEPSQSEDEAGSEVFDNFNNFDLLQSNPERLGIRQFDLAVVADRLVELSELYKDFLDSKTKPNVLTRQPPAELYTILFGKLLTPPKFDAATEDPTGLKVQIEALTKALKIGSVWYDFSAVEWRIRVGQVLWTETLEFELSKSAVENPDGLSERDVLLLQLALSCELLVRLDAVAGLTAQEVKDDLYLTVEEVSSFRGIETRKTQWDLVLARRFLDSVEAKSITRSKEFPQTLQPPPKRGFFSTASPQLQSTIRVDQPDIAFMPRKASQQLEGLFNFATTIMWPDAEQFEKELTSTLNANEDVLSIPSPSVYATPLSTPRSMTSNRSSGYFNLESRPEPSRTGTKTSLQLQPPSPRDSPTTSPNESPSGGFALSTPKALIGGWLTRSYLTGFVLPGEAISHLLISSLLENDVSAISALGDSANLYGGFVYKGRSWWSKGCIIGRVLACLGGAAECMGWVSIPCAPQGFSDGWIEVHSEHIEFFPTPRIKSGEAIESESSILAGNDSRNVLPTDFILPRDLENPGASSMWFEGLRLKTSSDQGATEGENPSYTASVHFSSSSMSDELGHCTITLRNLVQFISAYPCTTPSPEKLLLLKSTEETTAVDPLPAHPLHRSQTYEIVPAKVLLTSSFSMPSATEGSPSSECVLVFDARGDAIWELIARAWCSSHGEHAIVARLGVTCLSCAVREARAIATRVVIRVG